MPCFWCDADGVRLTRDHVVPVCAGGEEWNNIVRACDGCQSSRGRVQQHFGKARGLRYKVTRWAEASDRRRKLIRRWRRALLRERPEVLVLVAFWTERERERWGSSPTAALDLTIPDLPKRRRDGP